MNIRVLFYVCYGLSVLVFYLGVWGAPVRVEVAPLADVPRDDHVVAQQQDPVQVHRAPRHTQQQVLARVRPQQRHLQSIFTLIITGLQRDISRNGSQITLFYLLEVTS